MVHKSATYDGIYDGIYNGIKDDGIYDGIYDGICDGIYDQGLIQAVFGISLPVLGTLIWAYPNSILNKIITTSKCNSSFLITSVT